jgi:hypothetical protein
MVGAGATVGGGLVGLTAGAAAVGCCAGTLVGFTFGAAVGCATTTLVEVVVVVPVLGEAHADASMAVRNNAPASL